MFFRRLNWNVVGWLKTVSLISTILIVLGIAMMIYNMVTIHQPLKLGLSFTGGTDVTVKFTSPVTTDQVRAGLAPLGVTDATITTITKAGDTGNERYSIGTQKDFGDAAPTLWKTLGAIAPVDRTQSAIEAVGPSLSHEYLIKALEALVIAIVIQFVYIAFRFGWNVNFGLVTVIALVRDSLMMIGIYAIAQKRVDDAFLAAVLTVIGYSVMDTIVILDRIRENTKLMATEAYDTIVNTSILQTMTRSVNTLATVVVTLVALLALGGASLQNFAFALLVGICSGGYHSIFFSAPLVAQMQRNNAAKEITRREEARTTGARTVAEARLQGKTPAERDAIAAARRERRDRDRKDVQRSTQAPARYKKRRPERGAGAIGTAEPELEDELDAQAEHDIEHSEMHGQEVDPLDAQALGHHDTAYDLGHEEIVLNLEPLDEPPHATPPASDVHPQTEPHDK